MTSDDRGSLWVRYLGGKTYYRSDVFEVPTDQIPVKVKALARRGDVAEVWYLSRPTDFDRRLAAKQWP